MEIQFTKKDEKSGKYIITDSRKKSKYVYDEKFTGIFPRMWSGQAHHAKEYRKWSGQKNSKRAPTFSENIKYLFSYQIGHMYLRYFMWNFAGKQNDIQGHGEINKGNWLMEYHLSIMQDWVLKIVYLKIWLIIKGEILTTYFHCC